MLNRDTGKGITRFDTCAQCVLKIFDGQVRDMDHVGLVGFGTYVQTVIPVTKKGTEKEVLRQKIQTLRPPARAATCFFDAVAQCLQQLDQGAGSSMDGAPKWLVCLTDGDDVGSQPNNQKGELVTAMLNKGLPANLNMLMITVGRLEERNVRVIRSWVDKVQKSGGVGKHISEQNATAIASAFEVVAEYLATEVGGATEC